MIWSSQTHDDTATSRLSLFFVIPFRCVSLTHSLTHSGDNNIKMTPIDMAEVLGEPLSDDTVYHAAVLLENLKELCAARDLARRAVQFERFELSRLRTVVSDRRVWGGE
eukprot:GHVU01087315.1.p4 GENE.GHVU01087315.1~~GHVU01087315.1.p4  ORF type:complete len:109 (+),score=14.98 GHVU01087315.1:273-599(+)